VTSIETVADDLYFPEGPRWRAGEGKLYFSDVMAGLVSRLDEAGNVETVFEPGEYPSGLGFLDNGDMLIVATDSRSIVRLPRETVLVGGATGSDADFHADIMTPHGTAATTWWSRRTGRPTQAHTFLV